MPCLYGFSSSLPGKSAKRVFPLTTRQSIPFFKMDDARVKPAHDK
jgi:hypothetical protein